MNIRKCFKTCFNLSTKEQFLKTGVNLSTKEQFLKTGFNLSTNEQFLGNCIIEFNQF